MKYYVIDAFTNEIFKGNPAGVCILDEPISEQIMQKIAFENNLAETAFLLRNSDYSDLRWFTPKVEIDLCGHATLASAFVITNFYDKSVDFVEFHTKSGILTVKKIGDRYVMDFPSRKPVKCPIPYGLCKALNAKVLETYISRDILVLVGSEEEVLKLNPNMHLLKEIKEPFAFIVTAKSEKYDFVSRFFAPNAGIDEDPVTGSSHSTLIPFWSERLGKKEMISAQISKRGGLLYCADKNDRVEIGGEAVCYMVGEIL